MQLATSLAAAAATLLLCCRPALGAEAVSNPKIEKICLDNCDCDPEQKRYIHPTLHGPDHAMMVCNLDIQGVKLSMMVPAEYKDSPITYDGGLYQRDLPEWEYPKLLPPWSKRTHPPLSLYTVKENSVVLDIGAHYGLFSILVATLNPTVKVIAVEPIDWLAVLIEVNAKRNGLAGGQVTVLQTPLTKDGRKVSFFQGFWCQQVSNIYQKAFGDHGWGFSMEKKNLESITFKDLLKKHAPAGARVGFARIDCEGCEQEIMDDLKETDAPFLMQCNHPGENSNYTGREWQERPFLEHITEEAGQRCLDLQELGEDRILSRAAQAGRPVEMAILGLSYMSEQDSRKAMVSLAAVEESKFNLDSITNEAMRVQYDDLRHALWQVSAFFLASALEAGDSGVDKDPKRALDLYKKVAASDFSQKHNTFDVIGDLPMLPDVQSGSMFRAAEILALQGDMETALPFYKQAAALGHALARARLQPPSPDKKHLVGTNGHVEGHAVRQLLTRVRLEALGFPPHMHQILLGASASAEFDECMNADQAEGLPRFENVFEGLGLEHAQHSAHRFRSWLQSAMGCWLSPTATQKTPSDEL